MDQYKSQSHYTPHFFYSTQHGVPPPRFSSVSLAYIPQTYTSTFYDPRNMAQEHSMPPGTAQSSPIVVPQKPKAGMGLLAAAFIAYLTLTTGK